MAGIDTTVLRERLVNQGLAKPRPGNVADIVAWFGAVQAQDFRGAKWAVGLRGKGLTDVAVERAFNDGEILRTHVLRPTWHFVAARDIRWLLALSGPRVIARMKYRHRQLEIDDAMLARSRRVVARALADGPLTRPQLGDALRRDGIHMTPERLTHLIMVAELEGLLCSGPLRGRHFTYALMDDRADTTAPLPRDEALGTLAERYFTSHGPATLRDFSWWSGLSTGDATVAAEIAGRTLARSVVAAADGYIRAQSRPGKIGAGAWLLPNFDEYLVAYRDRRAVHGQDNRDTLAHTVIIDGAAAGTWQPPGARSSSIVLKPKRRLSREEWRRIEDAARRYARFVGRPVDGHIVRQLA
jgi:hypothetical protein